MNGPTRKEREKARHYEEILLAAEAVFAEKGFHGATTEEIARRAEFAVGTLYKFFPSKDEIYWAVLESGMIQRREFIREAFGCPEADPVQAIERYVDGKMKFFVEHAAFYRIFLKEHFGGSPVLTAERGEKIWRIYDESLCIMEEAIRRGVEAGRFRNLPPRDIALALEGITNHFLHVALLRQSQESYLSKASEIKTLFFRGALMESETKAR